MLSQLFGSKFLAAHFAPVSDFNTNMQPVIAVLSQAITSDTLKNDPRFFNYSSYVMSDYVQFFEGSGARVIPILSTESDEVTLDKLSKINGVLFPGGAGDDLYKAKAEMVYKEAIKKNDGGEYFPLFGICMGFEDLAMFSATAGDSILTQLESHHVSLTVKFEGDPVDSEMFKGAGDMAQQYETVPFAFQSHTFGVNPSAFETDAGLSEIFTLTSTAYDDEHKSTFSTSMEGKKYPFQGVQFHPEKQVYEWQDKTGYNHDWDSVMLNRYFADTWVQMARQNSNTAGNYEAVQKMIFENEDFFVTDTYYGDVYMFN